MGAATYSPLLVWLYQYGYRDLHGIDLVVDEPGYRGPILFQAMDLTTTTFEAASFDAIACLSVIEHGVPFDAYVREAKRILKPGGTLVTSTDYWATPVDTAGITAYGQPVRILDEAAIRAFLAEAARQGFGVDGPPLDPACRDRVVHWAATGLDFTFLVVTLTAPGA
jgi:SAM-dependent methyltransferase